MAKKQFTYTTERPVSDGPTIDFDAMTKHVIERVKASDKPDAKIGIISGIIELGLQEQEDAKMEWKGTAADKAAIIAKAEAGESKEYFQTLDNGKGVMVEYKRWPVKPEEEVVLMVDFPDCLVNRGQFFDENGVGEELPFRGSPNGDFWKKGVGKVVGKAYSLKESNVKGTKLWSLRNNSILWKLAQATGQLDQNELFKPHMLGSLIGEAALFNVHVYGEDFDGKTYLKEKVSFNGPVPGIIQSVADKLKEEFNEDLLHLVRFKGEQDDEVNKTIRQNIINSMTLANNFAGSDLEASLIRLGKVKEGDSAKNRAAVGLGEPTGDAAPRSKPVQKAAEPAAQQAAQPAEAMDFDSFDEDIPF